MPNKGKHDSILDRIDIQKFNPKNDTSIEAWLKYFNYKCNKANLDDFWKESNIASYLENESFNFFIEVIKEEDSWEIIQNTLICQFSKHDSNIFSQFLNLSLKDESDLNDYFKQKTLLGKKLNFNDALLVEGLTNGLPLYLKKLLIVSQIETPSKWINIANQLIQANASQNMKNKEYTKKYDHNKDFSNFKNQPKNEKIHFRSFTSQYPKYSPTTSSSTTEVKYPQKWIKPGPASHMNSDAHPHFASELPPSPCKLCDSKGIKNSFHWEQLCIFNTNSPNQKFDTFPS